MPRDPVTTQPDTDAPPTEPWDELLAALPGHFDRVEVTITAWPNQKGRMVAVRAGVGLAIGHCGQWVPYKGVSDFAPVPDVMRQMIEELTDD
jgi:hypothetical protein